MTQCTKLIKETFFFRLEKTVYIVALYLNSFMLQTLGASWYHIKVTVNHSEKSASVQCINRGLGSHRLCKHFKGAQPSKHLQKFEEFNMANCTGPVCAFRILVNQADDTKAFMREESYLRRTGWGTSLHFIYNPTSWTGHMRTDGGAHGQQNREKGRREQEKERTSERTRTGISF